MSTQYNAIQGPYDYVRTRTIAFIEHENVQTTIEPFIKDARILELACGSGYYTYDFLKWGGKSVLGVDISPVMIEEARRQGNNLKDSIPDVDSKTSFIVRDCTKPEAFAGGPFDLVFGAWLLNYAPDRATLTDMFRNISLNLKDGGHFVSVTTVPAEDPAAFIKEELEARPPPEGSGLLYYWINGKVEEGVEFHVHADTHLGPVDFDCFHLRKDVYEAAAREAGLKGKLDWGVTSVLEKYLRGEGQGGASLKELESYQKVPNYGLLVIAK